MTITVRNAIPADASVIAALVNHAYRPAPNTGGWTHERELVAGDRVKVEQVLALFGPQSQLFLISLDQQVLGCIHIGQHDECIADIGLLAISPNVQARGLGSQLLQHAEVQALNDFQSVTFRLRVLSARHALIAFYQRRGYHQIDEVEDYPVHLNVGIPLQAGLQVITLIKPAERCKHIPVCGKS